MHDFVVIGGGIAGASLSYFLADFATVLLIEQERFCGRHSTGRSAAVYAETYGNGIVRSLTKASRAFFDAPPPGFAAHPLLRPRGCIYIARHDQIPSLEIRYSDNSAATRLTPAQACGSVSILRHDYLAAALYDPAVFDIDVSALHQGFLTGAKRRGATLLTDTTVDAVERSHSDWRVRASGQTYACKAVVNSAGAWAGHIGHLAGVPPIGFRAFRRTAMLLDAHPGMALEWGPVIVDADDQFYFKVEAGKLLLSPADETPVDPCDVQPEELDLAIGVDRLQRAAHFPVRRIAKSWAGLRSFVTDGSPVVGYDPAAPGFFWLAAQGGFGIQTAPAMAQLAAQLARGADLSAELMPSGFDLSSIAPRRQYQWTEPRGGAVAQPP